MIFREETLQNVISAVTGNLRSIIFTFILALILVYFFSIFGFIFFQGKRQNKLQTSRIRKTNNRHPCPVHPVTPCCFQQMTSWLKPTLSPLLDSPLRPSLAPPQVPLWSQILKLRRSEAATHSSCALSPLWTRWEKLLAERTNLFISTTNLVVVFGDSFLQQKFRVCGMGVGLVTSCVSLPAKTPSSWSGSSTTSSSSSLSSSLSSTSYSESSSTPLQISGDYVSESQ